MVTFFRHSVHTHIHTDIHVDWQ